MTIRGLSNEYKPILKDLWHYCFAGGGESTEEEDNIYFDAIDLKNCLGYFTDEKLTSTYLVISFKIFVRGILMDMGGIAAVATFPQYRRKKQVSALATESLKLMRKNKQFISALYPFKYSFYRKYGYANCAEFKSVIAPPHNFLIPDDFKPLQIREIAFEESFKTLKSFREKIGPKYNLIMYDDFKTWIAHYVNKKQKIFVVEDNDEIVGYFITSLQKREGNWNIRLNFRDIIVANHQARLTVYDYIKKHTDQTKDVKIPLMGDEATTEYFDDLWEGDFKYEISGSSMFRVVDVVESLKLLEFDKNLTLSFTLKIDDKYAPWNEEPFKITIENGKAKIDNTDSSDFDFMIDINAFTQLFTGYRDIYQLIEFNKAKIKESIVSKINQAFPKRYTQLRTMF
ncbi:MAG TPA: GNAT family N-acetyltransferase [candidate division Zixibacteria bacterium]|nr:GNAT family N-acetyltransferase [candidate division Zixibacteria bacterium]